MFLKSEISIIYALNQSEIYLHTTLLVIGKNSFYKNMWSAWNPDQVNTDKVGCEVEMSLTFSDVTH